MAGQKNPDEFRDGERICRECQEWLPLENFGEGRAVCRPCRSKRASEQRRERRRPAREAREREKQERIRGNHRKCTKCEKWLPFSDYREKGRSVCYQCNLKRVRDKYRNASPERQQQIIDDSVKRKRKYRKGRIQNRIGEAKGALRIMRSRGMSAYDIAKLTGVDRKSIYNLERGTVKHVQKKTVERFYEGVAFLINLDRGIS